MRTIANAQLHRKDGHFPTWLNRSYQTQIELFHPASIKDSIKTLGTINRQSFPLLQIRLQQKQNQSSRVPIPTTWFAALSVIGTAVSVRRMRKGWGFEVLLSDAGSIRSWALQRARGFFAWSQVTEYQWESHMWLVNFIRKIQIGVEWNEDVPLCVDRKKGISHRSIRMC